MGQGKVGKVQTKNPLPVAVLCMGVDPHPEPMAQHTPDDCEEVNPMGEAESVPAALGQNSSSSKRMKVTSK